MHQSSYLILITLLVIIGCNPPKDTIPDQAEDFCSKIHRNDSLSLSGELAPLADKMADQTGVYVLEDGGYSLITRAWLTEYAEKSIDIQYFIFSTDNVGLIACDYLVRAADRGVKVRIIVDDIMVEAKIEDILTLDSHENIEIRIYNPGINLGKSLVQKLTSVTTDFRSANQRMHNKTFIVDNKLLITGGRNIADEYFDYDHEYNFRDRDVLLLGEVVGEVNNSFEEFWQHELTVPAKDLVEPQEEGVDNESRFDRLHQYACNPENFWPQVRTKIENFHQIIREIKASEDLVWLENVRFVSDRPGKNEGNEGLGGGGLSTTALVELINKAENSIDIQTPYLITTELGKGLFKEAVDRGVKVRILTNSLASTDNVEAFSSYQSDREALLKTGVRIFEFKPDAAVRREVMTGELYKDSTHIPIFGLHAKSMVVDNHITVIGTFNLDPRSANLNTECIAIIDSEKIASGVLRGMETEFLPENAWEITSTFNPDSTVSRSKRIKTWTRKALPKAIL